jgi:hypothetical protein
MDEFLEDRARRLVPPDADTEQWALGYRLGWLDASTYYSSTVAQTWPEKDGKAGYAAGYRKGHLDRTVGAS